MGMSLPGVLNYKVFCYTVCWRDSYCRTYEWKHKDFSIKKEAQEYAKRMKDKRIKTKPYILQTIVSRCYFKNEANFEPVYNRKIIYWSYEKKIKY
jgi:hypothetical protein